MEFAGRDTTDTNIGGFSTASRFAPRYTKLGSEFGDVFVIFEISPKFDLGTRFFF